MHERRHGEGLGVELHDLNIRPMRGDISGQRSEPIESKGESASNGNTVKEDTDSTGTRTGKRLTRFSLNGTGLS